VPQKILEVGFVKDVFGRRYTCPRNESYKGVNYLIQGCAAGIIKKAMTEIHTLLEEKKSNILLTIHDELVIEIHKSEEDELVPAIVEIMEDRETFRVPILVNIEKTTTDWSQKS
jgi:DNA polymerase-1